jgi:hypothetical protein
VDTLLGAEARPDVASQLARVRRALIGDELIPYLGPGLLTLSGANLPSTPEAVAAALHARAPVPTRIRTNMWSVAQFIESRRHRKTLDAFMADIFAAPSPPPPLLDFLARLPLALIVNAWYDDAMPSALRAAGRRDFVEIQGVARAGVRGDAWSKTYDADGAPCAGGAADVTLTTLYSPHGGVRPAGNFLVADSDYVEVLTEIDIQTPIPAAVKARRAERGFLFLGCPFHDQMLRTYARQIMKRSKSPHFAVVERDALTRNEAKFFADQHIEVVDAPLAAAARVLLG